MVLEDDLDKVSWWEGNIQNHLAKQSDALIKVNTNTIGNLKLRVTPCRSTTLEFSFSTER